MSRLSAAILAYQAGGHMMSWQVATLRLHFERTIRAGQLLHAAELIVASHQIRTRADIDRWLARADGLGVYPMRDREKDTTDAQRQSC